MRRRRPREPRIFFPWEGKGGLVRRLGLARVRPVLFVLLVMGVVVWIGVRERNRSGVRQTRATLLDARRAVDAYMAEHDGGCPPDLGAVVRFFGVSRNVKAAASQILARGIQKAAIAPSHARPRHARARTP